MDVALALVVAVLGAAREVALPEQPSRLISGPLAYYLAIHLVSAAVLLWRRQHPLRVGGAVLALSVLTPGYASPVAAYAVGAFGRDRIWKWVTLACLVAGWSVGAGVLAIARPEDRVLGPAVIVVAGLLGLYVGARRRLLDALTERAERAEREQELLAETARGEERRRLASEMHDVVSHRLNLMVLQAGALRVSSPDEAVRRSAEDLRQAGCQALAELRDLVGVLRTGEGGAPAREDASGGSGGRPAYDELAALVADSESVRLPVRLERRGDPDALTPAVRRTVYRVVQESLTNAHKHAPGAEVTVRVDYQAARVRVRVGNTAATRPSDGELRASGGGTGLLGLRRRVEMLGGTLRAAPAADGGFEVDAELPAYVPTDAGGLRTLQP